MTMVINLVDADVTRRGEGHKLNYTSDSALSGKMYWAVTQELCSGIGITSCRTNQGGCSDVLYGMYNDELRFVIFDETQAPSFIEFSLYGTGTCEILNGMSYTGHYAESRKGGQIDTDKSPIAGFEVTLDLNGTTIPVTKTPTDCGLFEEFKDGKCKTSGLFTGMILIFMFMIFIRMMK